MKTHDEMLDELKQLRAELSQEAFDLSKLTGAFKKIADKVKDLFTVGSSIANIDGKIGMLPKDQTKFIKLVNSMPYPSIIKVEAFVPGGMNATYLHYLEALLPATEHYKKIQPQVMDPYNQYLGRLLSDRKFSKSAGDDKRLVNDLARGRQHYMDAMAKCFGRNLITTNTTIGAVISRHADWATVFTKLNAAISNMEQVKISDLKNTLHQCTEIIELIIKELQSPGADKAFSQEAAARMSDYSYEVAKELEMYSLTYYRVLSLKGAIELTMGSIRENLT